MTTTITPTIRTRKPTGTVPWPLILIEGPEKTGKTYAAAALTASTKIGTTYWLDLGEGSADEYGAIPGADYDIIEHDGSWAQIMQALTAVRVEADRAAAAGEPPIGLIIDSMTTEWDILKDWTTRRAAKSSSNQQALKRDPNAEVRVPMNLWNEATARHRKFMELLMTFPGPVVMTARGKEIAAVDTDGRPIPREKDYRVEGHKTLGFDASVCIRLSRETAPMIVGARSLAVGVRPGVDKPRTIPDMTLEHIVFELLGCGKSTQPRNIAVPKPELSVSQIRDRALELAKDGDKDGLQDLWREAFSLHQLDEMTQDGSGDATTVKKLIANLANDIR